MPRVRTKDSNIGIFLITRKQSVPDICIGRVMRVAEGGTDHMLIIGKLKFRIMRRRRSGGRNVPNLIDVLKSRNPKVKVN